MAGSDLQTYDEALDLLEGRTLKFLMGSATRSDRPGSLTLIDVATQDVIGVGVSMGALHVFVIPADEIAARAAAEGTDQA